MRKIKRRLNIFIDESGDFGFTDGSSELNRELAVQISKFFDSINDYMNDFEKVVVYYDNGQESLGAIIDTLLITKDNVEHRIEFNHKEKRLFQVSDMLTFIDKIVYKYNHNMPLTKSEKYFFSIKDILGIMRQLKSKRI